MKPVKTDVALPKIEPDVALRSYLKLKEGLIEIVGMEIRHNSVYIEDAIEVVRRFFDAVVREVPEKLLGRGVNDTADLVRAIKGSEGSE